MSKVVSGSGVAEYKRWQVPDVTPGASGAGQSAQNKYLTASQLDRIQKQAYEEAFARGVREGLAAGQSQVRDRVKLLAGLAALLEKPLKNLDEAVEKEILQLSLAIAKQIIRREISLDSGHIISVIREALAALPYSAQKIKISLHPDDAEIVRAEFSNIDESAGWTIIDDPTITKGGCKVFTEHSQIDATLENRLATIFAKIMGGERGNDNERV